MIMRQKRWIIGGYIRTGQGWWYRLVGGGRGDRSKKVSLQGENVMEVGEREKRD
jgi:hypothetical protein